MNSTRIGCLLLSSIMMKNNSMSYFLFAFLFTFLLGLSTLAHHDQIPNNGERIPNYAWPNEIEESTSGSIVGYYLPKNYELQEANNPSLVSKAKKGDYSTTSEYQLDKSKTTIGINFPGGRINFRWPFSSSMIMDPKTETTPFNTATTTWNGPSNQHDSEDPITENRRRVKKKNRKMIPKPPHYETRSMTNGGKAYREIDDDYDYQPEW
ncbi:hypothetical protein PIB30_052520 [Stylosanthes scabra]|uniref:Uncharacterized protein n=1 Tax=Stylosanthes scabra TaxID=79078 RepID=A0ABU6YJZ4_9FABA|nr:hypothetical protein [Stylosanthes scabra]